LIQTADVKKHFTTDQGRVDVLRGIDLQILSGERIAIVGSSGAGKTTLMHIMGGLDRPSSGMVTFEDQDVYALKGSALDRFRNSSVGFVFQFHQLLPEFTALENVAMPALIAGEMRNVAEARAGELLAEVGLGHRFGHKPGQLSGGEQQRVAIARALIMSPKLLMADEPTGNLDSTTTEAIYELLQQLHDRHGLTMIIVTHSERLALRMDRILHMVDGLLVA
jgi:lipoprotein-releasing system ATP-binding protein